MFIGELRTIKRFQWWPTFIQGKLYWFKTISVRQELVKKTSLAPEGIGAFDYFDWIDLEVK